MDEVEVLPVVKWEDRTGAREIMVDWHGQWALIGPCKGGVGSEFTWIWDDMTGVQAGDHLAVISKPYHCQVLGVVR